LSQSIRKISTLKKVEPEISKNHASGKDKISLNDLDLSLTLSSSKWQPVLKLSPRKPSPRKLTPRCKKDKKR